MFLLSRKLASVRFVTSSLQRYVERLFALEEYDGYMTAIIETHPHHAAKIDHFRREHDRLRESLRQIVLRLETLAADDGATFDAICKDLQAFVTKLDHHLHAETALLEDAYLQDTGGEGGL